MYNFLATLKSIAKIVLQSRPVKNMPAPEGSRIIVMGNGPSLNDTIASHLPLLKSTPSMAVNFAALAPVFFDIRPRYYVLADPHFFGASDNGGNLDKLRQALARVEWKMTLFVPAKFLKAARKHYSGLDLKPFNFIGLEGYDAFTHAAFSAGLGMPRPRNVLVPAIMLAIGMGYKEVVITGADHSWMKTLSVTDDNEVVSVQPHFYADSDRELSRIRHDYQGIRLHEVVESFAIAFRSYHHIVRYARSRGVRVLNATPGSFIDAFERIKL